MKKLSPTLRLKREKILTLALLFGLVSSVAHAEALSWSERFSGVKAEKVSLPAAEPARLVLPTMASSTMPALALPTTVEAPAETSRPLAEAPASSNTLRKSGVNEDELMSLVSELDVVKDNNKVYLTGVIPLRCAPGAQLNYAYDKALKVHALTLNLPACEGDTEALQNGEPTVALSDILQDKTIVDESGKFVLRHSKAGDKRSKRRSVDVDLKDLDGKLVTHTSAADIEAARLAAASRSEGKSRFAKLEDLERKIDKFCKSEDIDALNAELLAAADLLGNVSGFIEKTNKGKLDKYKRELGKADSVEKADAALEAYKAAANEVGEDEDGLKAPYIAKRFEIMTASVDAYKGGEKSASDVDGDIKGWAGDLNALDSSEYRKRKAEFGSAYSAIGTSAANAEKYDEAVSMYGKGKKYVSGKSNAALDGQISKVYLEQFMACSKKDPSKTIECETKYIAKSKAAADAAGKTMKGLKGEDSTKDYDSFMAEYAGVFGAGTESTVANFGTLHQQPGAVEKYKAQLMQEMQQKQMTQLQQQQMQMMQQQMGGGVAAATPAAGAGLLGLGIR